MGLGSLMRWETAVTGLPGGACARASTQDGSTRMGLGTRYRTTPPPPHLHVAVWGLLISWTRTCRAVRGSAHSGVDNCWWSSKEGPSPEHG